MVSVSAVVELPVDSNTVWQLIGGFGALSKWSSHVAFSDLGDGGRTRHVVIDDGDTIVERLLSFDDEAMSYTYTIDRSPLPVTDYRSTLRVLPAPDGVGSKVLWSGRFTPVGVSNTAAHELFQRIYADGLSDLVRRYAIGDPSRL
jgi:hypothetical protein